MFEILLFAILGTLVGIVTGLVPGLHINTLIPVLFSIPFLAQNPEIFSIFLICLGVAQIFTSFIPSIFLGAPEEDTALSVLPGHKILHEGRGYEAIKLVSLAGTLSLGITLVLVFAFSNFFKIFYEMSRPFMSIVLSLVIFAMVLSEKNFRKMLYAATIIFLAGFLGFAVLNGNFGNKTNILFPLLSGFFGLSTILLSIAENTKIPQQSSDDSLQISYKKIVLSTFLGSLAGIAVGFLPAIGVSQAATFMQFIAKVNDPRSFLATLSGINVANEIFSLNSLYLIGNPRSGTSVALERILGEINFSQVILFIGGIAFAVGVSSYFAVQIGKRATKILEKIDYRKLSIAVALLIVSMIFVTTGPHGLLVAFASTSLGILCAKLKVKRTNCMGVLLVPTTFFFAGLNPLIISILRI